MALPFQLLAAQSARIFRVKGTGLKSCLIFDPQWGLAIHKWQPQRGRERHRTLCSLVLSGNMGLLLPPQTCKPTRWRCCHQGDGCCEKRNSLQWKKRGACTIVSKLAKGRIPATEQRSTKFWTITGTQRKQETLHFSVSHLIHYENSVFLSLPLREGLT